MMGSLCVLFFSDSDQSLEKRLSFSKPASGPAEQVGGHRGQLGGSVQHAGHPHHLQ